VTIDEIKQCVENQLSRDRFKHTLGVAEIAEDLAVIYGVDTQKAIVAALLHDIAKEFTVDEKKQFCKTYDLSLDEYLNRNIHLTHGNIGAHIAKEQYNIQDKDVLNAISNHTLGSNNMSDLEKIIYLADMIEPNRTFHSKLEELRRLAYANLNEAMKVALYSNIVSLSARNREIHPIIYSILEEYKEIEHMEGSNETIGEI